LPNGISTEPIHNRQHIYNEKNCRKSHVFNTELHNIDYTHAFDSVFRDKIIECLNKYETPSKLIKLIAKTLQDTKARVKVNQNYTEKFEITTGVKATRYQQLYLVELLTIFKAARTEG